MFEIIRKLSDTTTVKASGETVADLFEALGSMEEIFSGHDTCGLCNKTGVSYTSRRDKEGNRYFQARCKGCGAEFRFGQLREPKGRLFPQLKDAQGNWKPNGGWAKWTPQDNAGDQQQHHQQQQPAQQQPQQGYQQPAQQNYQQPQHQAPAQQANGAATITPQEYTDLVAECQRFGIGINEVMTAHGVNQGRNIQRSMIPVMKQWLAQESAARQVSQSGF